MSAETSALMAVDASGFDDVVASPVPVLVDFWADWCQPCTVMHRVLEEVASELAGQLRIATVDVEQYPDIAEAHDVRGLPTLILFANGEPIDRIMGAQSKRVLLPRLGAALGAPVHETEIDADPTEGFDLIEAVAVGHLGAAEHLLDNGADIDEPDENGRTVVAGAVQRVDRAMVELLLRYQPKLSGFEHAALGDLEDMTRIVEADPSVLEATTPGGMRCIDLAASWGRVDMMRYLLSEMRPAATWSDEHCANAYFFAAMSNTADGLAVLDQAGVRFVEVDDKPLVFGAVVRHDDDDLRLRQLDAVLALGADPAATVRGEDLVQAMGHLLAPQVVAEIEQRLARARQLAPEPASASRDESDR